MQLSIIIVSYKSDNVINDCLLSIEKHNDLRCEDIEVIVVDNYKDSTLQIQLNELQAQLSYSLKYVRNDLNGGFGQGNNVGVSAASGNILLFLNPDTILIESVFYITVEKIQNNAKQIIGYTLVDKELKPNNTYSFFPQFYILNGLFILLKKIYFYLPNKSSFLNKMIWPWGAAFALDKQTFLKAGKFDENIFLCNEEPDLLKRIPGRQVEILQQRIIHLDGHTVTVEVERFVEYLRSTKYYFGKYNHNWRLFVWYLRLKFKLSNLFCHMNHYEKNLKDALNYYEQH